MISNNLKKRFYTSIALLSLVILIFNFNLILMYSLIVLGVISILEFLNISKKIFKYRFSKIFYNILFSSLVCLSLLPKITNTGWVFFTWMYEKFF